MATNGLSERRRLQIRRAVGRWFWVLAIVLVVLAIGTGWVAAATYASPGTTTEQHVVSSWSTRGSFEHETTVVRQNPVFAVGTTLKNRSMYYRSIAPTANGTYRFEYRAPDGDVTVHSVVRRQIRSVGGNGDGGPAEVYWTITEPVAERRVENVSPGTPVSARFRQNISSLVNRTNAIAEGLGGSAGSIETRFVAVTTVDGEIAQRHVHTREQYVLPVSTDGGTYSFGDVGPHSKTYERTDQVEVPNTYGPVRRFVSPAVSLLAMLGLLGLWRVHTTAWHELDRTEAAELEFRTQRAEYDEWISTATLPDSIYARDWAPVESLEDLVDVAIDADERVIEDRQNGVYIVPRDTVTYRFTPPIDIDQLS